jgi:hypothetical protein
MNIVPVHSFLPNCFYVSFTRHSAIPHCVLSVHETFRKNGTSLKNKEDNRMIIDGVWIGNRIYWALALNYNNLTQLHTTNITVSTVCIKSSQSSLAVAL